MSVAKVENLPFPGPEPMVSPWPKGKRVACMLTFDFDADVPMAYRGVTEPVLVSMGKFGPKVGVPNILNLLAMFGIKACFFVPAWVAERYPASLDAILTHGHEVGHHGDVHEPPTSFTSYAAEEDRILRGIDVLTLKTGRRPRGYRSPFWEFSSNTIAILDKHGFDYTSDLMDTLIPDFHSIDGKQSSMLNLPVHWVLDDLAHIFYHISARKPILTCAQVLQHYKEEFDGIRAFGGLFTLTMHPEATGRPSRILMMKTFIEYILSFPDAWITTPDEVVAYWRSRSVSESL